MSMMLLLLAVGEDVDDATAATTAAAQPRADLLLQLPDHHKGRTRGEGPSEVKRGVPVEPERQRQGESGDGEDQELRDCDPEDRRKLSHESLRVQLDAGYSSLASK